MTPATLRDLIEVHGLTVALYDDGRCLTEVVRGQWEPMPHAPPPTLAPVTPPGDWFCHSCPDQRTRNRAHDTRCYRCGNARVTVAD